MLIYHLPVLAYTWSGKFQKCEGGKLKTKDSVLLLTFPNLKNMDCCDHGWVEWSLWSLARIGHLDLRPTKVAGNTSFTRFGNISRSSSMGPKDGLMNIPW